MTEPLPSAPTADPKSSVRLLPIGLVTLVMWAHIASVYVYKTWYIAAAVAALIVSVLIIVGSVSSRGLVRAILPVACYFAVLLASAIWAQHPDVTLRWVAIDSIELVVFFLVFVAARNAKSSQVENALLTIPLAAVAMALVMYVRDPNVSRLVPYGLTLLTLVVPFLMIRIVRWRRPLAASFILFLVCALLVVARSRAPLAVVGLSGLIALLVYSETLLEGFRKAAWSALIAALALASVLAVPETRVMALTTAARVTGSQILLGLNWPVAQENAGERADSSPAAPADKEPSVATAEAAPQTAPREDSPGAAGASGESDAATGTSFDGPGYAWTAMGSADFDSDGRPDMVWRNLSTGENGVRFRDGPMEMAPLPSGPPEWELGAIGDMDGDGHPDLVWRNPPTGENTVWLMNGMDRAGSVSLMEVPLPWALAGAGDFDMDGVTDLVWRDGSTGRNILWLMDGPVRLSYIPMISVADSGWSIVATDDFDGDGGADIAWRHDSTGENVIWFMDGANRESYVSLRKVTDPEWRIQAAGDYDGDGQADLFWRNTRTGENAVWFMTDATWGSLGVGVDTKPDGSATAVPQTASNLETAEGPADAPVEATPADTVVPEPISTIAIQISTERADKTRSTISSLSHELLPGAMPLGIGYMNFTKYSEEPMGMAWSLHNTHVAWLLEGGIATVAIILWLVARSLRDTRRYARLALNRDERDYAIACVIALGGVLLFGLFHQVHQGPALWMMFALCAACGAEAADRKRRLKVAATSHPLPDSSPTGSV